MSEAEIMKRLTAIFRDIFHDGELVATRELTPNQVPQWTSLSHAHLMQEIEKQFVMKFTFRELRKIQNVSDLVEILLARKNPC